MSQQTTVAGVDGEGLGGGGAGGRVVAGVRLAFAGLTAAALATQAYTSASAGRSMVNFFSFFTIQSNVAMTVVLLVGGVLGLMGRPGVPDPVRGAVTLYMGITGLVYAVALSGIPVENSVTWVNDVVHRLMPVVILIDWLAFPPTRQIRYREALVWLVFPLLYLPYTLIRGPIADWYPYPFLDPREKGYAHVVVSSLLVTVAFLAFGALLVWAGNLFSRRRAEAADPIAAP